MTSWKTPLTLGGQLWLLLQTKVLGPTFFRFCFLAAAAKHGVLRELAGGPVPLDELTDLLAPRGDSNEILRSWLELGCVLGELERGERGYSLRGSFARRLARLEYDNVAALFEAMGFIHAKFILGCLDRLRAGERYASRDYDHLIVARASRSLEPFLGRALDKVLPAKGRLRLLEVGCGSGVYIRRALERNASLTAVGVELRPEVAALARNNMTRWGIDDRAEIEVGDFRDMAPRREYDFVSLHNNVYYFPVNERVSLLEHARRFLRPGGQLLVTTGCEAASAYLTSLSCCLAAIDGCGRLPAREQMIDQMRQAGFRTQRPIRLVPGDGFYLFTGRT